MSQAPAAHAKHALLIGIDAYPRLTPLHGCVNDIMLMRGVLQESFGFAPDAVATLVNQEATRAAILAALDALVERTQRDDIVLIHYAGHGSLMTDREGDEPSGYDSTIMPVDSEGWQGDNRDITDDEINVRLQRLAERTQFTTLIFDCCHSGTISRDAFGMAARSMPPDTRPASELPPSPVAGLMRGGTRSAGRSGWLPLEASYVLIAGCRDDEVAYEYRPPEAEPTVRHGALTYFLTRELRQATPGTTYRDIFERAAAHVNAANPAQHPQIEGTVDREVFGITDIVPMQYARVTARDGETVRLAWGAAMGATAGSCYDVYAQAAKSRAHASPLGTIEVTHVHATECVARITAESTPDAIGVGARAVQTRHAFGDLRLGVQVVAGPGRDAEVAALRERLIESPLLHLAGEDEHAFVRVYLLERRTAAGHGDAVPQLDAITRPCWAAVRRDGRLLMAPAPLEDAGAVAAVLHAAARYTQAFAIENHDAGSALRGAFDIELVRRAGNEWVAAQPEDGNGVVAFEEGDVINIRVRSHHHDPVFVTVLDFDCAAPEINVLCAAKRLAPGVSFTVTKDGFRLQFPRLADTGEGAVTEGVETVKLIVTTSEADFSWMAQGPTRSEPAAGSDSPLMGLWRAAAAGGRAHATRAMVALSSDDEDWTTVMRPFILRRRTSGLLEPGGAPLTLGTVQLASPGLAAPKP